MIETSSSLVLRRIYSSNFLNFLYRNQDANTTPGAVLYNSVIIVIDLAFLLIKFWFRVFVELYYGLFGTEERNVSNDIVLITGTGHGIGKELALQYSALGATIVGWDINEALNAETIKHIKSKGGKAFGYT